MSECTHDCSSCGADCSSRDLKAPANAKSKVKKVIAVVSGKGGVGKSTVTASLAAAMAKRGRKVAVLDADITGPSIPTAFGIHERAMATEDGIQPAVTPGGIKLMSLNLLTANETDPVVWRGPVIANVVKQFWSDVVWGEVDYMFVDNAAMQIIRQPAYFDVIVTENMFGDILTDEASVISGSLGMLPSASVGSEVALFEPIHGSYPQAAGKNIANPMATILSAAMLLEHLGLDAEGRAVRRAVDRALAEGVVTEDLAAPGEKARSTSEVGDYVASQI